MEGFINLSKPYSWEAAFDSTQRGPEADSNSLSKAQLPPSPLLASHPQPTRPSLSRAPLSQSAHILILGAEVELLPLLSLGLATEQG